MRTSLLLLCTTVLLTACKTPSKKVDPNAPPAAVESEEDRLNRELKELKKSHKAKVAELEKQLAVAKPKLDALKAQATLVEKGEAARDLTLETHQLLEDQGLEAKTLSFAADEVTLIVFSKETLTLSGSAATDLEVQRLRGERDYVVETLKLFKARGLVPTSFDYGRATRWSLASGHLSIPPLPKEK